MIVHLSEDPGGYDMPNARLIVTWYEAGSYEGSGTAYVLTDNGKVEQWHLSHCSCNGPWEAPNTTDAWPLAEFLRMVASEDVAIGDIVRLDVAQRFAEELAKHTCQHCGSFVEPSKEQVNAAT
jgi:hypothetical protein